MKLTWQILVGNFASVALFISAWMHVSYRYYRLTKFQAKASFGVAMGLAVIASILLSVQFKPGVYFDLRLALIELSALFGGPVAVLVAATLAALFRVSLGGLIGPALGGMAIAAATGMGAWLLSGRGRGFGPFGTVIYAAFVGVLSVAVLVLLPSEVFRDAVVSVGLQIAVLNACVIVVGSAVITYFRRFTLEHDILRAALTQAPDFHYVKGLDHRFVATNLNVARHHGRERASDMVGLGDDDLETAERAEELRAIERRILETGLPVIRFEECIARQGEAPRWYSTSKVPLRNRNGELIGIGGVTVDISERKKLEQELKSSRDIVTQATAEMSDGLALFDADGRLLFCNTQYRDLFPRSGHARVPGAHFADILLAVVRSGEREGLAADMSEDDVAEWASKLHQDKDETFRLYDGRWIQVRTRIGENGSSLVVTSDITAAKEAEFVLRKLAEQMKGLAETDGLTGVANRRSFDIRLEEGLRAAAQGEGSLALLLMDIDHFKAYNDTYGHLAGDDCLQKVRHCLAGAAGEDDFPARYGGEEFAIILPGRSGAEALEIADTLRSHVRNLDISHRRSEAGVVTVSIGVAVTEKGRTDTPADLIGRADAALYRSKEEGRNRVTLAAGVPDSAQRARG